MVQVKSRDGTPIIVDGVGFAEGPRWTVGRSKVNDLHDAHAGVRWSLPGHKRLLDAAALDA